MHKKKQVQNTDVDFRYNWDEHQAKYGKIETLMNEQKGYEKKNEKVFDEKFRSTMVHFHVKGSYWVFLRIFVSFLNFCKISVYWYTIYAQGMYIAQYENLL